MTRKCYRWLSSCLLERTDRWPCLGGGYGWGAWGGEHVLRTPHGWRAHVPDEENPGGRSDVGLLSRRAWQCDGVYIWAEEGKVDNGVDDLESDSILPRRVGHGLLRPKAVPFVLFVPSSDMILVSSFMPSFSSGSSTWVMDFLLRQDKSDPVVLPTSTLLHDLIP